MVIGDKVLKETMVVMVLSDLLNLSFVPVWNPSCLFILGKGFVEKKKKKEKEKRTLYLSLDAVVGFSYSKIVHSCKWRW